MPSSCEPELASHIHSKTKHKRRQPLAAGHQRPAVAATTATTTFAGMTDAVVERSNIEVVHPRTRVRRRRRWLPSSSFLRLTLKALIAELPAKMVTKTPATATTAAPAAASKKLPSSLLVSIMLPLLLVFLLPTLRLEPSSSSSSSSSSNSNQLHSHRLHMQPQQLTMIPPIGQQPMLLSGGELLLTLLRLPLDRMRLVSGLTLAAEAKEITTINSRHDLQEEETHLQMLAPAEHRSSYMHQQPPPQQQAGSYQRLPPGSGYQAAAQGEPTGAGQQQPMGELTHGGGPQEYAPGGGADGSDGAVVEQPPAAGEQAGGSTGVATSSAGQLQARSDLPAVRALNVKCEKNHMTVNIVFDRPFYGMVFSKGHYNDQKCVHLPANSGQTSVNFDIHLGKCGMTSSDASGNLVSHSTNGLQQSAGGAGGGSAGQQQQQPNGLYIENTVIIQYDPQVQEIYDQARKLRCTWYDYYEKSVTFRPYNVDMLDAVTANFLGDNIQCWMQIQVGKGPWSSEVAGIVKIGQTMTMVLAIKDDENRFDMLVRNCVAHDGKHQPIQLVDEYGCVARPKIMAKFQKVRNFGPAATVVSYAHFQAFKFPDSMSVHFQCVIQVCRYECPEPVCNGGQPGELAGGGSGGAGGANGPPNDYAASGTELVASKEPMPSGGGYFMANHSMPPAAHHSPPSTSGAAAVNLKLDETQGRVQVKLDTSMMAGLSGSGGSNRATGGALPPHLLQGGGGGGGIPASEQPGSTPGLALVINGGYPPAAGARTHHLGSSYYKPQLVGGGGQPGGATSAAGRPAILKGRVPVAPPSHSPLHYSSPYPPSVHHLHRAAAAYATNRIGELAENAADEDHDYHNNGAHPLGLGIGSPRALRPSPSSLATPLPFNHRHRRSVSPPQSSPTTAHHHYTRNGSTSSSTSANAGRGTRSASSPDDSTAIKTHKTIQVVSPDDVAFSLLADGELDPLITVTGTGSLSGRSRGQQQQQQQPLVNDLSTICFSAGRLMFAVLITLAAVAATIVIVTFVILKQRAQLDEKLSSVYEPSLCSDGTGAGAAAAADDDELAATMAPAELVAQLVAQAAAVAGQEHQQQQQLYHNHQRLHQPADRSRKRRDEELVARRQREEIQQRNNYLARLYSQFVPATYWRH